MNLLRKVFSIALAALLLPPFPVLAQQPGAPQGPYKLTILDAAGTSRRANQGRISSQAVVEVTDENNNPVAGVIVTFTIPQLNNGGAAFANGGSMSIVTTNEAGVASSGTFSAQPSANFPMAVSASTPNGVVAAAIPIALPAAVAGGMATGAIVGIIVAIGAAAAAGAVLATRNNNESGSNPNPPPPATPRGTIGGFGAPTFGGP